MIVRLHNLSARTLKPADVDAVAALMTACDMFEIGNTDEDGRRRELQETWQVPGFDLSRDAWVIVQKQGLIVGYGDIRDIGEGSFEVYVCVHPEYRGRGIGTLLSRLIEARARERMLNIDADLCVTMRSVVNGGNEVACRLFHREGYECVHRFWKVVVEMHKMPAMASQGLFKFDFVIDANA